MELPGTASVSSKLTDLFLMLDELLTIQEVPHPSHPVHFIFAHRPLIKDLQIFLQLCLVLTPIIADHSSSEGE